MNKLGWLYMLILFCTLTGTQQTAANDALADLEQIFTDNVRIVDYSISSNNTSPATAATWFDNDQRLLMSSAKSYPYPEEIQIIHSMLAREDNVLIIWATELLPDTGEAISRRGTWVWFFDRQTESFTRFMPLCGYPRNITISDIDNSWIYVSDPVLEQVYLCETATGKMSNPLPAQFSWHIQHPLDSTVPVFVSPDGDWLLLFGEKDGLTYVLSYNILSEVLIEHGGIPCTMCIGGIAGWVESRVMVWSWDYTLHKMYSVDITRADSLELALTRPWYLPEFYENPLRFDYVNFTTPENLWDTQCERVIYDFLSGERQVVNMGSLCRPEQGSLDGIGYYRDVTRGETGIAALTRFDARTREREILHEGEIERIEWVSADEQYAVLVMGTNGQIDILPFFAPHQAWTLPDSPKLAYVDLISDRIIFEQWTGWYWCDESFGGPDLSWSGAGYISETSVRSCGNVGPTGAILPREDGTLLVIGALEAQGFVIYTDPTGFADIVSIGDDGIERQRITEGLLIPYSVDYILSREWDSTRQTQNYSLISVDSGSPFPITNDILSDDYYTIEVTDIYPDASQLRFYISPKPELGRDWHSAYVLVQMQD